MRFESLGTFVEGQPIPGLPPEVWTGHWEQQPDLHIRAWAIGDQAWRELPVYAIDVGSGRVHFAAYERSANVWEFFGVEAPAPPPRADR